MTPPQTDLSALERGVFALAELGLPLDEVDQSLAVSEVLDAALAAEGDRAAIELLSPDLVALEPVARDVLSEACRTDLVRLGAVLETLEASDLEGLVVPPTWTDDVGESDTLHAIALRAIALRERLHGFELLGAWASEPRLAPDERRLEVASDALRALLPRMTGLVTERAALANHVPAAAHATRWWLTEPIEGAEAAEGEPASSEDDAWARVGAWAAERWRLADDGRRVLRLDADEAASLLSTERGQTLAEELDHLLDLDALLEPEPALSAGDVWPEQYRDASIFERAKARIAELIDAIALAARQPVLAAADGAIDEAVVLEEGPTALTGAVFDRAAVVDEVGLVLGGLRDAPGQAGSPQAVVLLLPVPGIAELSVDGRRIATATLSQPTLLQREHIDDGLTFVVGDGLVRRASLVVATTTEIDEPTLLVALVAAIQSEDDEMAEAMRGELVVRLDAPQLDALERGTSHFFGERDDV